MCPPPPPPPYTHTHTGFSDGNTLRDAVSERRGGGECETLRMAIRVMDGKKCYGLLLASFPGLHHYPVLIAYNMRNQTGEILLCAW